VLFGDRLEIRAADELQMLGKLAGGGLLDNRRFIGQDDSPGGGAVLRQVGRIQRSLAEQQAEQRNESSSHGFPVWLRVVDCRKRRSAARRLQGQSPFWRRGSRRENTRCPT